MKFGADDPEIADRVTYLYDQMADPSNRRRTLSFVEYLRVIATAVLYTSVLGGAVLLVLLFLAWLGLRFFQLLWG